MQYQCVYFIINVIFTLLQSIFMNFKVFLLISDISIFMLKYPLIYLRYIRKIQVPIYPSKPIFLTLHRGRSEKQLREHLCACSGLFGRKGTKGLLKLRSKTKQFNLIELGCSVHKGSQLVD